MTDRRPPVIAVVGGGIAGLAAAWELVGSPAGGAPAGAEQPVVYVLEADDRLGGKLRATELAGRTVDLAADAFLARRPEATELVGQLGITDQLVPVGATGASILARGRLRAMPAGLNLGVPTRWWPLARSGILSAGESLRAARDLVAPHPGGSGTGSRADGAGAGCRAGGAGAAGAGLGETPGGGPPGAGDRSVAEIVGDRLGRAVVERLADPLIGGINAGGVDDLSASATFPALLEASRQAGSLMRALGRSQAAAQAAAAAIVTQAGPPAATAPVFWSLRDGTADLATRLVAALTSRGVTIRTGTTVEAITRSVAERPGSGGSRGGERPAAGRWELTLGDTGALGGTGALLVDGIVLAVPAPQAARLLAPHAPDAASILGAIEYASVTVVTMAVPGAAIGRALTGTGFLVPRTTLIEGRAALATGCTYLSRKWPHLAGGDQELLRVSVGRFGDDRHRQLDDAQLAASVVVELTGMLNLGGPPTETLVTRWSDAFPQYRVGHPDRVARVATAVAALPAVALAGAAYNGVGIPACIGSGRAAARDVLRSLGGDGRRHQ